MRKELTPQQLADFENSLRKDPAAQKLRELTVERTNQMGGLTLELLRLVHGVYWGEPYLLTFEEAAAVLGRPVSELMTLYDQMADEVRPVWMATPEYQKWKASQPSG